MPKGQYTRGRLIMLQVIMWIIFGMCMGMAAFVTAKHRAAYQVDLADPIKIGPFKAQLPKGWKITTNTRSTLAIIDAGEPQKASKGRFPRRVTVFVEKLDEAMFPQVYLRSKPTVGFSQREGILSMFRRENERPGASDHEFEPYPMAGTEGVQAGRIDSEGNLRIFASAVLPDPDSPPIHWAVTVRMMCDESFSAADRAAFRQVAESIVLTKN